MSTSQNTPKTTTFASQPVVQPRKSHAYWRHFLVNAIVDTIIVVFAMAIGLATGFEGKSALTWSSVGDAVSFLFGGFWQLLALIIIIGVVAAVAKAVGNLFAKQRNVGAFVLLALVFVGGGLTFTHLTIGAHLVQAGVFLVFVAIHAWFNTTVTRKSGSN